VMDPLFLLFKEKGIPSSPEKWRFFFFLPRTKPFEGFRVAPLNCQTSSFSPTSPRRAMGTVLFPPGLEGVPPFSSNYFQHMFKSISSFEGPAPPPSLLFFLADVLLFVSFPEQLNPLFLRRRIDSFLDPPCRSIFS